MGYITFFETIKIYFLIVWNPRTNLFYNGFNELREKSK